MRRFVLLTAVVALACSAQLWAADKPGAPVKEATTDDLYQSVVNGGARWSQAGSVQYVMGLDKTVTLTDAQKKAIRELCAGLEKSIADFKAKSGPQIKAALAAASEAYKTKGKDSPEFDKAYKAVRDVFAPQRDTWTKWEQALRAILTPEQRATLDKKRADERKAREAKFHKAKTD